MMFEIHYIYYVALCFECDLSLQDHIIIEFVPTTQSIKPCV